MKLRVAGWWKRNSNLARQNKRKIRSSSFRVYFLLFTSYVLHLILMDVDLFQFFLQFFNFEQYNTAKIIIQKFSLFFASIKFSFSKFSRCTSEWERMVCILFRGLFTVFRVKEMSFSNLFVGYIFYQWRSVAKGLVEVFRCWLSSFQSAGSCWLASPAIFPLCCIAKTNG
jgi:hypothetical protein